MFLDEYGCFRIQWLVLLWSSNSPENPKKESQWREMNNNNNKKKGAQTHKAACQRAACWCWWAAAPLFPMWGASLAATVLGKKVGVCVMEHTVTMWISRFDLTHTSHFVRSEFICIKRSESRNWIQSHRSLSCMWWIVWYPVLMQGLKL